MNGSVDVVVVAYRSSETIRPCLEAVKRVDRLGSVVVVDHGNDGTAELAEELGARVLHDPSNPGFGAGQNHGIALTTAPSVLLCNPDAVVEPGAIAEGLHFLEEHPDVGAVQGVVLGADGEPERSQGVALLPIHLIGRASGARRLLAWPAVRTLARRFRAVADHAERVPSVPADVEFLAATVVLVRRTAFEAIGGFDEGYFLYGEDMDLCHRLLRAGFRLVALPTVWARHQNAGSFSSSTERELHWWRGVMGYAARWWTDPAWGVALAAAALRWTRLAVGQPAEARRAWTALVAAPREDRRRHRHRPV